MITFESSKFLLGETAKVSIMNVKFEHATNDPFYTELKKRVDQYFSKNNISKHANTAMIIKVITLLLMYLVPYFLILTLNLSVGWMFALCVMMGTALAGVGMSVMHDSCHGSLSANRKVNEWMSYTMDFIGGHAANWKVQHNVKHHTYTNILGADEDIHNGHFVRLSPHAKHFWFHRYQHIYSWALYLLGTLGWVTLRDFKQLKQYHSEGLIKSSLVKAYLKLIPLKLLYWTYMIFIPMIVLDVPFWYVFIGFAIVQMVAGLILTVVFQLAHIVEDLNHDFLETGKKKLNHSWAVHQIRTTANFARNNRLLNWYLGGLNFQIEHHLFPHICHIHYNRISEIVKKTVQEFDMTYMEFPTMRLAMKSHYRTLKRFSSPQPQLTQA